jgi:trehalose 6-phosphate phosphatase
MGPEPHYAPREESTPPLDTGWAVFLDVDGTLLEIAIRPEDVVLPPGVSHMLQALQSKVPAALISGRRLADLDRLFAPLTLSAAGQHGAERRSAGGQMHRAVVAEKAIEQATQRLAAWARGCPEIVVENKRYTLAVHYRCAPHYATEIGARIREALQRLGKDFVLVPGKMILEIRPRLWDKGRAIADFMSEPPFAGRVPVFIGDDVSDEDGFAMAQSLGGHAIKVGTGATVARWRLADVSRVLEWLNIYLRWLG